MNKEILNTIILATAFLALFSIAELLYHYARLKAEITRKIVHVFTGVLTLLFPVMLSSHWSVLFLCASFAAILLASLHFKLLPSINAIDRKSAGSLCYPLAVYLCFLVYTIYIGDGATYIYLIFYNPILILAICDPIAALVGRNFPWGKYRVRGGTKTISGSMAFFIVATLISFFLMKQLGKDYFDELPIIIIYSIIIGLFTALAEAVTGNGYDNLTIPFAFMVGAAIVAIIYINYLTQVKIGT